MSIPPEVIVIFNFQLHEITFAKTMKGASRVQLK
jgi:hypothetical protein